MSESDCDKHAMVRASSAPLGKKEGMLAVYHGDSAKGEEGATTDLSCPFMVPENENFNLEKFREWSRLRSEWVARSIPNNIIIPDPTPKWVRDAFREICPRLELILKKDSVRCFLRLFESNEGMHWDLTITAETLTYVVIHNALRCARVVLEGKAPQLHGMHANPNCMNPYGYFPLHEAAERFSVDMIKLLFCHGASANVRTVGDKVIENLLPLHVAVENACLHKYLEDNLSPRQDCQDYTYNLIHLLCLPEMKIFLDTIKLLAGRTDNLVDELWKYIEGKKLVETAVLLLAAQGEIRGSHCSKNNVNGNQNGFNVIMDRLVEHYENAEKHLEERRAFKCTYLLVRIISSAGEVLHAYIQRHSEVPHLEVLEHVSSVLMSFGFCPSGEGIDVKNLCPYDCKISDRESHDKEASKAITETARAAGGKVVRKKIPRGWDPEYTRRMFFPYWRSVLLARCLLRVYPSYAPPASEVDPKVVHSRNGSISNGSTQNPNLNLELVGRMNQPASNLLPKRPFGTVAFRGSGFTRNPYHNIWSERSWQPRNHQSRRLFGTAAFTLLRLLKSA